MSKFLPRFLAATALAATALTAQAGAVADVTLRGWAYGGGNAVHASTPAGAYAGQAGAFGGSLAGTPFDTDAFVTYCIELEEQFAFSGQAMTGYRLVDGASYFQSRRGDASIAADIGRLFTYASDHAQQVTTSSGSTALQLAVWNLVYDGDHTLAAGGSFSDNSAYASAGTALLAGGAGVANSRFEVYALQKAGSQDFLVAVPRLTAAVDATVPEPGSLGLAAAALAGLAVLRRRAG